MNISIKDEDVIKNGHGEYIVYEQLKGGRDISEKNFKKGFSIIQRFSALACIKNKDPETYSNRHFFIREAIKKELGCNFDIAFVPRTLYELCFIRKLLKEDDKAGSICEMYKEMFYLPDEELSLVKPPPIEVIKKYREERKCWHSCFFTSDPGEEGEKQIESLAYRLNKSLIKLIDSQTTFKNLLQITQKIINFYFELNENYDLKHKNISTISGRNLFVNFAYKGAMYPMVINSQVEIEMIQKAITLDSSEYARQNLFLYRCGDLGRERTISNDNSLESKAGIVNDGTFSYSYGTSLFAGVIHDPDATVFYYAKKKDIDCYILTLPLEQIIDESPFYVPLSHSICQLFGAKEYFHGRSKTWKNQRITGGIQSFYLRERERREDLLQCKLERTEFIKKYEAIYQNALILRTKESVSNNPDFFLNLLSKIDDGDIDLDCQKKIKTPSCFK